MERKSTLVVAMLVLGMASSANTTYSVFGPPVLAGPVTWDVISDQLVGTGTSTGVTYDGYLMSITFGNLTPDPLSDGATTGAWIAGGELCKVTLPVAGIFATYARGVNTPQSLGKWFSFDISGLTNPMTVDIWGTPGAKAGTITIIPEPMTIALLGLGAVMVRKRKDYST